MPAKKPATKKPARRRTRKPKYEPSDLVAVNSDGASYIMEVGRVDEDSQTLHLRAVESRKPLQTAMFSDVQAHFKAKKDDRPAFNE